MWVFSLYTMVDGFFVAHYVSEKALSSVNLALPFVNALFAISILLATGTQTLLGMMKGHNERDKANRTFSFTLSTLAVGSVFFAVSAFLCIRPIMSVLGAVGEYRDLVYRYLSVIIVFSPFFMLSYNLEILVKVDGFPKLSVLGVTVSCLTNIGLDYLFIKEMGMGVAGAALATGIAQMSASLLFLGHFLKRRGTFRFVPFKPQFKIYKRIIWIGMGAFLSELSGAFLVLVYNRVLIHTLGYSAISAFTVINYVSLMVLSTILGVTQGIAPLCSYYYGKNEPHNYRHLLKMAIFLSFAINLLAYLVIVMFPQAIFGLFIKTEALSLVQMNLALRRFALGYIFLSASMIISGYFASLGLGKKATVIAFFQGFISVVFGLAIATHLPRTQDIWFAYPIGHTLTFIVALTIFIRTRINRSHRIKSLSS